MKKLQLLSIVAIVLALASCSVTRHIAEPQEVVSRVYVEVDGRKSTDNTLQLAVAQHPYHRTFGFLPIAAWMWHNDTVRAIHRLRRKLGTQPPVYDEMLTSRTCHSMQRAMVNQGYLNAEATADTVSRRRKVQITYHVRRGHPMKVSTLRFLVEDPLLQEVISADVTAGNSRLHVGQLLDRNLLEQERIRLTGLLRDNGFYDFNKEHVSFLADTIAGSKLVELTLFVSGIHDRYTIGQIRFVPNYDLVTGATTGDADYLRPSVLAENCHLKPGDVYKESLVRKTYSAYSRLRILKYVNIRFEPNEETRELDCTIHLSPTNPHSVQFELDGTNTSGDLGFAASVTYQHRNLFRGSETYSATLKGGYESLSGDLSGLVNNNYTEYSFENQIDFPRFLFPFLKPQTRRRFNATTAVKAVYSYQNRPEFTRILTQAGWVYKWTSEAHHLSHSLDAVDLSYVYMPKVSVRFDSIMNLALNNSYRSHFIMSSAYSLTAGNATKMGAAAAHDVWSLRINPEIGGNVLAAASRLMNFGYSNGRYQIFNLPFEQYLRLDVDFAYNKYLGDRSRLAFHWAGGVAAPYGNSDVMPFEKRYYSGGANSVRGWSVRSLGPGRYPNNGSHRDILNQCGDIRLDASVELRSKLFWKFEGAAFIDAGNVWTIKEYDTQYGGAFDHDFLREIAVSWGLGVRLVTDFVVLRVDLGVKAYDPTKLDSDAWVVTEPLHSRNRTVHFAVGYPF